jgi:hypothetical protein
VVKINKKKRILDEETTKRLEVEICNKVVEYLNTNEVKLEMKLRIEEGCQNLINEVNCDVRMYLDIWRRLFYSLSYYVTHLP